MGSDPFLLKIQKRIFNSNRIRNGIIDKSNLFLFMFDLGSFWKRSKKGTTRIADKIIIISNKFVSTDCLSKSKNVVSAIAHSPSLFAFARIPCSVLQG